MMAPGLAAATMVFAVAAGGQAAQTSSIVLTPDERTVCAVNQDSGSISFWDWSGAGKVREVKVGEEPRTLAVSPDGKRVYVTNERSQTLSIVEVSTGHTAGTVALGGQPYGVLLTADGTRAFVSQYAGAYIDGKYWAGCVAVVDLSTGNVAARVKLKPRPWAMAMAADGSALYVTHYLHVGDNGIVTEIDPKAMTVRREILLRADADVRGGQGGIFNALAGIALHPNGRRAVVVGMHANVRRGRVLNGQPLSHKTTVQAALRILDLEHGREIYDARIVSSFAGQAVAVSSAVTFIGTGEHFIDLYFASNDFKVIKYNERGLVAERAVRAVPPGPSGIVVTRDARTGFINSRWGRSVSEVSLANVRDPVVVRTVRVTGEPWDRQRIRGAILFHNTRDTRMTANRWMSCGVCHIDGGQVSDGLVWDLTVEEGQRKVSNTMDLVLTAGTAPPFFHRGTTHVALALERFVRIFQGGSGFLARADLVAGGAAHEVSRPDAPAGSPAERSPEWEDLLAFVSSLRPRPNPHMDGNRPRAEIRAAAERGRQVFFDRRVGCSRCHKGHYLTRSGTDAKRHLYNVGTGMRADVPSLLDLWDTAPYLHDGRAATLREVLTKYNPHDGHGHTSHLSKQELNDLIQFLLAPYEQAGVE